MTLIPSLSCVWHYARCTFCKLHVLQVECITNCTCFKLHVLQIARVTNCTCCKLHVLQIACYANCMCCNGITLNQVTDPQTHPPTDRWALELLSQLKMRPELPVFVVQIVSVALIVHIKTKQQRRQGKGKLLLINIYHFCYQSGAWAGIKSDWVKSRYQRW